MDERTLETAIWPENNRTLFRLHTRCLTHGDLQGRHYLAIKPEGYQFLFWYEGGEPNIYYINLWPIKTGYSLPIFYDVQNHEPAPFFGQNQCFEVVATERLCQLKPGDDPIQVRLMGIHNGIFALSEYALWVYDALGAIMGEPALRYWRGEAREEELFVLSRWLPNILGHHNSQPVTDALSLTWQEFLHQDLSGVSPIKIGAMTVALAKPIAAIAQTWKRRNDLTFRRIVYGGAYSMTFCTARQPPGDNSRQCRLRP